MGSRTSCRQVDLVDQILVLESCCRPVDFVRRSRAAGPQVVRDWRNSDHELLIAQPASRDRAPADRQAQSLTSTDSTESPPLTTSGSCRPRAAAGSDRGVGEALRSTHDPFRSYISVMSEETP